MLPSVTAFILKVLDDDEGISQVAYDALTVLVKEVNNPSLNKMMEQVESTNGRYYLPPGVAWKMLR